MRLERRIDRCYLPITHSFYALNEKTHKNMFYDHPVCVGRWEVELCMWLWWEVIDNLNLHRSNSDVIIWSVMLAGLLNMSVSRHVTRPLFTSVGWHDIVCSHISDVMYIGLCLICEHSGKISHVKINSCHKCPRSRFTFVWNLLFSAVYFRYMCTRVNYDSVRVVLALQQHVVCVIYSGESCSDQQNQGQCFGAKFAF